MKETDKNSFRVFCVLAAICIMLSSCRERSAVSRCHQEEQEIVPLLEWEVYGPVTAAADSLICQASFHPASMCLDSIPMDTSIVPAHRGIYHPRFHQLDLREVYGMERDDSVLSEKGHVTYLRYRLFSPIPAAVNLQVKTSMPVTLWLNKDSLLRRDIQGLNFYPLHLRQGDNMILARLAVEGEDLSFEASLCGDRTMERLFAEGQSGNIIYPLIRSDSNIVMLTNTHQNITSSTVTLAFHDVCGRQVSQVELRGDSLTYPVPELEKDVSYLCSMHIGSNVVRQPVLCGKDDDAYVKFSQLRERLPDSHPCAAGIDQLLYRLHFLLNHPSRYEGDWWWQFKITPVTYQLEHTFAHLDEKQEMAVNPPNIQFVTYRSTLDGGIQRYVLAIPNEVPKDRSLPLVVVVRPFIENHRHFFSSPQIARQWAVNIMQALSNRYGYVVMMPEARMYQYEELSPMAEAEIKQAIADVMKHYDIDADRIYLHANCSGAYRALQLAESNPGLFAAIGLFAPVYQLPVVSRWSLQHAPERGIRNLAHIPVFVHGDPVDKHSSLLLLANFVRDCVRNGIELELSFKRNTGKFYNVVVVGEETFDFFKDKKREGNRTTSGDTRIQSDMTIADFYAKPFLYVYDAYNQQPSYRVLVDSIRSEYEHYFFTKLPLCPDTAITLNDIRKKNLFFIGNHFENPLVQSILSHAGNRPQKNISRTNDVTMSVHHNLFAKDRLFIIYAAESRKTFQHVIVRSWMRTEEEVRVSLFDSTKR